VLDEQGPVLLGRRGSVDEGLGLDDSQVSRHHAVVEPGEPPDEWVARDLGSRNGTFANGCRSARATLRDGDVIRIGETMLLYQVVALAKDAPLAPESGGLLGRSVMLKRPKSIRERRPEVPAALERAVIKCLAKDPADRHQNVAELAAALAPFGTKSARLSARRVIRALGAAGLLPRPVGIVGDSELPPLPGMMDAAAREMVATASTPPRRRRCRGRGRPRHWRPPGR
jgi:hypothetical protein